MTEISQIALIVSQIRYFAQTLLGIFGLYSIYLFILECLHHEDDEKIPQPTMDDWSGDYPQVTVQLPIFNERFVIGRLIKQCTNLDWPSDKLEIQVLDDSNDGTHIVVEQVIAELQPRTRICLSHIRRGSREGFKAGALKYGTARARGEFLAIFDADFMPSPDFLKKIIPSFSDAKVAAVQGRWGHLNFDHSLVTQLQGMGHDGHFMVEQFAKNKAGHLFNFNGTGGVWRRQAILDAGDWSADTLAEDLDLSYRAQLGGWTIKFRRDIVVNAELPVSITAFKKQQARWARGSMQTALKLIRRVWSSRNISFFQKLFSTIHLFGYGCHPLMFVNLICTVLLFFLLPHRDGYAPWDTIFLIIASGPPFVVAHSQNLLKKGYKFIVARIVLLILLHHGMTANNTLAVLAAWTNQTGGVFERTPKFGSLSSGREWSKTAYFRQLGLPLPIKELTLALILILTMYFGSFYEVHHATYPWLAFFALGFLFISFIQLGELFEHFRTEEKRD